MDLFNPVNKTLSSKYEFDFGVGPQQGKPLKTKFRLTVKQNLMLIQSEEAQTKQISTHKQQQQRGEKSAKILKKRSTAY